MTIFKTLVSYSCTIWRLLSVELMIILTIIYTIFQKKDTRNKLATKKWTNTSRVWYIYKLRGKRFTVCTEIAIILGTVQFTIRGGRLRYKRYDAHFLINWQRKNEQTQAGSKLKELEERWDKFYKKIVMKTRYIYPLQ
jgi:hypothetical protein